jgi:hypothetical protein
LGEAQEDYSRHALGRNRKMDIYNHIVCGVRPMFFRFLYPHYMSKYNKELKRYNLYCHLKLKKSFEEILTAKARTPEEEEIYQNYKNNSFFLDNNSVVNRISRYMRANLGLVDRHASKMAQAFDYRALKSNLYELNYYKISQMKEYLQEYKAYKKACATKYQGMTIWTVSWRTCASSAS